MDAPAPRFPWSLFLALALALGAVPVALDVAWRAHLARETRRDLAAIAQLEAEELASWRAERLLEARGALGNPLVHRAAVEAVGGQPAAAERFTELLQALTRAGSWSEALLADAEGRVRASASRRAEPLDPAKAELSAALRGRAPLLSDVCAHAPGDAPHLHLVVPVPDAAGEPLGAIALRLEAEPLLYARVAAWGRAGVGTALVRRDEGSALVLGASPDGPLVPGQRISLSRRAAAPVRAVLGEEGEVEAEDEAGRPVLAALRAVPGTGWHLVVHAARDGALGALTTRAWGLASLAAALIGGAALVVGARFRRQRRDFEAERAALLERIHARHADLLVRHANDVALLLDADLRILDANDRVLDRYGWAAAELRGQHVSMLRADGDRGAAEGLGHAAGGPGGAVWEVLHRRRDGSTFPAEVSARAFEVDGRTYLQASVRDVSDRKRAEAAVAYQAMLLERLEDAVVGTDPALRVTFWNRAAERLFGWSAAEAVGRKAVELLQPEVDNEGAAPLDRELLEKGSATRRSRMTARDGRAVHVETTYVALREPGGSLTGYVGVNRDLSRLRQAQERLAGAERLAALGALAGGIAHEINNPLAYLSADVRSAADALAEHRATGCGGSEAGAGGLADAAQALAEAESGARRIAAVVRDLQAFARSPAEGRGLVDLRATVRAAAALVHNAVRHRARLELQLDEVPPAPADAPALTQALVQILDAVAAGIPEGRAEEQAVRVATRADGGGAALEVQAGGAGLGEAQLRSLLDPAAAGGLSAAGAALRAAGAGIAAHRPEGGGTSLLLRFPAPPRPAPQAAPRQEPAPGPSPRRARVLVVDDEPLVGRAVSRLLSPEHEVVVEADGRAAAARLEAGDLFDLVLCDLMMPDVTGMELHERLSARRPAAAARMVFMTGGAFTDRAREFLEQAQAPCLEKPFDPERLRALVAERLGPARPG